MAAITRGSKAITKIVNKIPKIKAPKVNLKVPVKGVTASKIRQPKPEMQE